MCATLGGAACEIASLTCACVDRVESGSKLVRDAGSTMTEIVESVARAATIINEITATAEQRAAASARSTATCRSSTRWRSATQRRPRRPSIEQRSESLELALATFKLVGDKQFA
jgi:methyl-accepting chemotaxis protein